MYKSFSVVVLLMCCVMCSVVNVVHDDVQDNIDILSEYKQNYGYATESPDGYLIEHAALPRGVAVYPLPLVGSDHELALNVTWDPPVGPTVREYSIEVHSVTSTVDCYTNLCYEYNLPGNILWSVIPTLVSPVPDGCAVRPGCAYSVKVIAHPWDGHTSANINVELDECVVGVCSCAHAPRLPRPSVSARTISVYGELYVNVTWSLPAPVEPLRLPPGLRKQYYFISIGKQMVSDAHPAPWYADTVSRRVDADGFVYASDNVRWLLLPTTEHRGGRSDGRSGQRSGDNNKHIVLDVKLLVRVNLIDERGCVGPAGNATAYDPTKAMPTTLENFVIWVTLCCVCVVMTVVLLAFSARAVKKVLTEFRPVSASASVPLQALCARPAWFQLDA